MRLPVSYKIKALISLVSARYKPYGYNWAYAVVTLLQKSVTKTSSVWFYIERYGIRHLYTYLRLNEYNIAREALYNAMRDINSEGLTRRAKGSISNHRRGEHVVPGPNRV